MSVFANVAQAAPDAILGLTEKFKADTNPNKVNLGVGVYQDDSGRLPLMSAVAAAQKRIVVDAAAKSYLPIDGLANFNQQVQQLVFGADNPLLGDGRIVTVQALGGTGALKVGADFLRQISPQAKVLISSPSWENHQALFTRAGFQVGKYRYYDPAKRSVDVEAMLADLAQAPAGTIVVLHACCHNPTGYDLSASDWDRVLQTVKDGQLVAFLDMAYQGFSQGLEQDAGVVRKFADGLGTLFVSSSFSKNLGLYGERAGALSIVCADADEARRVGSQVKIVVRTNYSNPPTHGALLAATVLADEQLRAQWVAELTQMRERIKAMRQGLVQGLQAQGVQADLGYITTQIGMFSFSGLTKEQMIALRSQFSIYGTDAGRICVAALNSSNLEYVAGAIAAVWRD